jgi:glyoxylase-like metal-dependent hydrolase (beta-lactamase superfamily II)
MPRLPAHVLIETNCRGHAVAAILGPKAALGVDAPLLSTEAESWRKRIREKGSTLSFVLQMDASPDRAFAATHLASISDGVPPTLLAHQLTCDVMKNLQDSYKNNPLTGVLEAASYELDPLSLRWPRPAMAFNRSMTLQWDPILVEILHAPSTTPGACWVHLPEDDILFVGDAVSTTLPPLLHEARFDAWLETLSLLHHAPYKSCRIFSAHGGWVNGEVISHFANFLRSAQRKVEAIRSRNDPQKEIPQAAAALLEFFSFPAERKDFLQRRLQVGLHALWEKERAPAPEKTASN